MQILHALKMERIVTIITIGLIQIVAALNILITLVMMVMEKHRDIAILMSMGTRANQIRKIFVFEGVLIGGVGTAIGLVLGFRFVLSCGPLSLPSRSTNRFTSLAVRCPSTRAGWTACGLREIKGNVAVSLVATLYPARSAPTYPAPVKSSSLRVSSGFYLAAEVSPAIQRFPNRRIGLHFVGGFDSSDRLGHTAGHRGEDAA